MDIINTLKNFRICSKCEQCKEIINFKPKRQECNECLLERKRQYYRDNIMKFKKYYVETVKPKLCK